MGGFRGENNDFKTKIKQRVFKNPLFTMWQDYEKDFSRVSHMTPNFHIAFFLANKLLLFS